MIKIFNKIISFGIFLIPLVTIHLATIYNNVVAKYMAYGYNFLFLCTIPVSIVYYFLCKHINQSATKKPPAYFLISKIIVVLLTILYILLLGFHQWYWSALCWLFGGVYSFMYISLGEKYAMQTDVHKPQENEDE